MTDIPLSVPAIAVFDATTGALAFLAPADFVPDEGMAAVDLPADFSDASHAWDLATRTMLPDLAKLRAVAIERVNVAAEASRGLFLTPGTGQAMTYLRKEAEARAWSAGADPSAFPFLAAEAVKSDISIEDVVAMVIAQANAWATIGSTIEGLRRGAVVAIEAASTPAAIAAAEAVTWPA